MAEYTGTVGMVSFPAGSPEGPVIVDISGRGHVSFFPDRTEVLLDGWRHCDTAGWLVSYLIVHSGQIKVTVTTDADGYGVTRAVFTREG